MNTTKSPEQIAALAAELNEADIAAIMRAKAPATINGLAVESVWLHVFLHEGESCLDCTLFAGGDNDNGKTFADAERALARRISNASDRAAKKRAEAAKLLAEAASIEGGAA